MPGAGSASWTSMVQPPGMFRSEGLVHPSASMSVEQATSRVLDHAGVSQAATGVRPANAASWSSGLATGAGATSSANEPRPRPPGTTDSASVRT